MVGHASLFSQMLSLVDRHRFERLVREHKAERGAKGFSCWSQFVAMMFCQLAQAKSLREIIDGLACCEGKLRHLGLEASPKRSTLSYANGRRPWQLFEALFYSILEVARASAPGKRLRFKNKLFSPMVFCFPAVATTCLPKRSMGGPASFTRCCVPELSGRRTLMRRSWGPPSIA